MSPRSHARRTREDTDRRGGDGELLGFAVWRDDLIDLMMIDHRFHRHGLGTRLLLWVEEMLGRTHHELRLESFAANHPANSFYRHHGWLEADRYLDGESGVSKIVFRKARTRG